MPERPNFLVIMSDQHAPDITGCYGNARVVTPNLDRLAAAGMCFDAAYCNNPMCVPSRMSFLTGRTTNEIEVWSLSDTIRSDELTWPVLLGAAGYDTIVSGRLHMWWPDKLLGFQQRLGGDLQSRLSTGTFELYEDSERSRAVRRRFSEIFLAEFRDGATGVGEHRGYDQDRQAVSDAISFLQARQRPDPFALYVGLLCPHSPLHFPRDWYERYADLPVAVEALDPSLPPALARFAEVGGFTTPIDPQVAQRAVRAYYAMVSYIDSLIGELMAALEASGQLENTVVVYTSDHGEMLGRRGLWYKNQLLEPAVRTPLICRYPRAFTTGSRCALPVSLVDLLPTMTELAATATPDNVAGTSLLPLLTGTPTTAFDQRPVFIEYADYGIGQPAAAIRQGTLKLLSARGYDDVLYDLERDPGETVDVSRDPAYAGALSALRGSLARYWDADDTYRRVVRNQQRTELIRQSRLQAAARGQQLTNGISV